MGKTGYQEVAVSDVRPGDVYKFISTAGLSFFGEVVAIYDGMVKVRWWDQKGESWTYKWPEAGRVVFGRSEPSPQPPQG